MLLSDLLIMSCLAWFLIKPRTTSPGIAPPTMDWALPHQPLVKRKLCRLAYWSNLWRRHFLYWGSLLSDYYSLCQADIKLSSTASEFASQTRTLKACLQEQNSSIKAILSKPPPNITTNQSPSVQISKPVGTFLFQNSTIIITVIIATFSPWNIVTYFRKLNFPSEEKVYHSSLENQDA